MLTFLTLTGAVAVSAALVWLRQYLAIQRLMQERMFAPDSAEAGPPLPRDEDMSWLRWWLFRAGFRSPLALETYLLASGCCLALGGFLVFLFYRTATLTRLL